MTAQFSLTRRIWPAALLLLLGAVALRIPALGARGLTLDEIATVTDAMGGTFTVPSLSKPPTVSGRFVTAQDYAIQNTLANVVLAVVDQEKGNTLVYQATMHAWVALVGVGEFVLRIPSVVFGTLAVVLTWQLARLLFGEPVGVLAGVLSALHPVLIDQSRQARAYPLAALLSLLATLLFVRLWRASAAPAGHRTRTWLAYVVVAVASVFTHYLAGVVLLGHAIFGVLRLRDRRLWVLLGAAAVLVVGFAGAWLLWTGGQRRVADYHVNEAIHAVAPVEGGYLPLTPRLYGAGLLQAASSLAGTTEGLDRLGGRLRYAPLALVPAAILVILGWTTRGRTNGDGWLLCAVLASAGALAVAGLSLVVRTTMFFDAQYLSPAIPYVSILAATGLAPMFSGRGLTRAVAATAGAACLLLMAPGTLAHAAWQRPIEPNGYRRIADTITRASAPGDLVEYPSWGDARLFNLYLPAGLNVQQSVVEGSACNSPFRMTDTPKPCDFVRVVRSGRELLAIARPLSPTLRRPQSGRADTPARVTQ
jgi:uncharacterized membrane protein